MQVFYEGISGGHCWSLRKTPACAEGRQVDENQLGHDEKMSALPSSFSNGEKDVFGWEGGPQKGFSAKP